MTPRAWASKIGVRSPAKYGSSSNPSLPGGVSAASATSCPNGAPPLRLCTQPVSDPDVAMPAASVREPGSIPDVLHNPLCLASDAKTCTKNIVEPYISMRSPGCRTPALNASAQASTVPAQTGVPSATPGASAAALCTVPTTSPDQASRGSSTPAITSAAQSPAQS